MYLPYCFLNILVSLFYGQEFHFEQRTVKVVKVLESNGSKEAMDLEFLTFTFLCHSKTKRKPRVPIFGKIRENSFKSGVKLKFLILNH